MISRAVGAIFVTAGILFLGIQVGAIHLDMAKAWPLFILVPGLLLELGYVVSRDRYAHSGLLVPGGILTVIGLLFFFEVATEWQYAEYTWPVYPGATAFGLFQLYWTSFPRPKGLLIPVFILGAVTVVSFAIILAGKTLAWLFTGPVLGIVLILVGAAVLIRQR